MATALEKAVAKASAARKARRELEAKQKNKQNKQNKAGANKNKRTPPSLGSGLAGRAQKALGGGRQRKLNDAFNKALGK